VFVVERHGGGGGFGRLLGCWGWGGELAKILGAAGLKKWVCFLTLRVFTCSDDVGPYCGCPYSEDAEADSDDHPGDDHVVWWVFAFSTY